MFIFLYYESKVLTQLLKKHMVDMSTIHHPSQLTLPLNEKLLMVVLDSLFLQRLILMLDLK